MMTSKFRDASHAERAHHGLHILFAHFLKQSQLEKSHETQHCCDQISRVDAFKNARAQRDEYFMNDTYRHLMNQ